MKISIKQLKQIIKEEVGLVGGPASNDGVHAILDKVSAEVRSLAQALAVEIANGQNPGGADHGEADAYLPEVEDALNDALLEVVKQFE